MMATAAGASRPSATVPQHPRDQHTQRDQRLRTQAIVERQPGGQEHRTSGEHNDRLDAKSPPGARSQRRGTKRLTISQRAIPARVAG